MAEPDFEAQLSRLFDRPPSLGDAEQFAARVTQRLERGWAIRRIAIGATGVVAGLAAAAQLISSRFSAEFSSMSHEGAQKLDLGLDKVLARYDLGSLGSSETVWLAVALALAAVAFAVTRLVDEV
ncbi:MAG: hypothetical protein J7521_17250 [Caulobacter sp.]|nr:hypothetical protein [Caulobacter sp.]